MINVIYVMYILLSDIFVKPGDLVFYVISSIYHLIFYINNNHKYHILALITQIFMLYNNAYVSDDILGFVVSFELSVVLVLFHTTDNSIQHRLINICKLVFNIIYASIFGYYTILCIICYMTHTLLIVRYFTNTAIINTFIIALNYTIISVCKIVNN